MLGLSAVAGGWPTGGSRALAVWFTACWLFATQKDGISALSLKGVQQRIIERCCVHPGQRAQQGDISAIVADVEAIRSSFSL